MDKFLYNVKDVIKNFNMLESSQNVFVGLSGGADSCALLIVLCELGYNVKALHLNHCLRGEESQRDEKFCIDLCKKYGVDLIVRHEDVEKISKENKKSIETTARELRYKFFKNEAKNEKIATAHNSNDVLETMIFHMVRGTGLTGLCSIPPVRNNIIRPLISCSRSDIENYLRSKNQNFVVDSSNLSNEYTRNKIRNQIIPILKQINPNVQNSVFELALRLRQEENFLSELTKIEVEKARFKDGFNIDILLNAHKCLRHRMLKHICEQHGIEMGEFTSKHVIALENLLLNRNPSAKIYLPSGFLAKREYKIIKIERKSELKKQDNSEVLIENLFDKKNTFEIKNKISLKKHKKNYVFYKTFNTFYVDCDTIDMKSCVLRTRKTGDKICISKKSGTKTLKKLFIEKKIPSEKRCCLTVIADKYGVIAVENIGIDISRTPANGDILEIKFKG